MTNFGNLLLSLLLFIWVLTVYMFIAGLGYTICWYIYTGWIKPQTLNPLVHGLVSAAIFGPVMVAHIRMTEALGTPPEYYFVFATGGILLLAFLMTKPVVHLGSRAWQKLKGK